MKYEDLAGLKSGRLTALRRDESGRKGGVFWVCKCDCGNEKVVFSSNLKFGTVKSCGCIAKERKIHNYRIFGILDKMKQRCYNKNVPNYKNYGGRGIRVCDEWTSKSGYRLFYEWAVANGYGEFLSIERKDVNGNYCPENCTWATFKEQQNNKRDNHKLTINGITKNINQWSEETGIHPATLHNRLNSGWNTNNVIDPVVKTEAEHTCEVVGVSWLVTRQKWRARAWEDHKEKHLGYFDNVADAAKARKEYDETKSLQKV